MPRGQDADISYEIFDLQVNFGRKMASLSLNSVGQGMVFVSNFPFDPTEHQSESEMKRLVMQDARRRLLLAADSLI